MKPRIIFTTHTYFPALNGVAVVNEYLTKGLVRKGYKIIVVTHFKDGLPEIENHDGIEIHRIYRKGRESEYIGYIRKLVEVDDVLINVCLQTPTTDILLSQLSTIQCRKKILYVHGIYRFSWASKNFENPLRIYYKIKENRRWRKYYTSNIQNFRNYDDVIQLHEYDDGNILFGNKFGIRTNIMNNAVEDMFFSPKTGCSNHRFDSEYIISVSNYSPEKNQEMCVKAYYRSEAQIPLVLVGKDSNNYIEYLKKVEKILKERGKKDNKKVIYLKDIERPEIAELIKGAKLFLFGSKGEKLPLAVCESMAAGVPFVSTDVGVVKYLPGGMTVHSVAEMSKEINKLLGNKEYASGIGEKGKKYADMNLRVDDKVNQFEQIIIN